MVPDQLELTPGILRALLTYAPKYRQFAAREHPALEPYDTDGVFARGECSRRPGAESLAPFEIRRCANLEAVRDLPRHTRTHKKVGPIWLFNVLNECAHHDLAPIPQITELVRAVRFYPNLGLYSKFYKVNL